MATVDGVHIQVRLTCEKCGHQWDHNDYGSISVDAAQMDAESEPCPKCGD